MWYTKCNKQTSISKCNVTYVICYFEFFVMFVIVFPWCSLTGQVQLSQDGGLWGTAFRRGEGMWLSIQASWFIFPALLLEYVQFIYCHERVINVITHIGCFRVGKIRDEERAKEASKLTETRSNRWSHSSQTLDCTHWLRLKILIL